jgi:trimeric autotransporter adhesin
MLHGSFLAVAMLAASATESVLATLPATSVGLGAPHGIVVDERGRVYVAAEELGRVFRVDPSGSLTIVASGLAAPCGVALRAHFLFVSECEAGRVSRVDLRSGTVTRFAGLATTAEDHGAASTGDGGPAVLARLMTPAGLAFSAEGDLLIVDRGDHRLRRVAAATGLITTMAGDGIAGDRGDTGPATSARLDSPEGVAIDRAGSVYLADRGNNRVRRIDRAGVIATVAGDGRSGLSGDGGPATLARLTDPTAVAFDRDGRLLIADRGNGRIRSVSRSGVIGTVAEGLPGAHAIAVGPKGTILVAEARERRILRLSPDSPPVAIAGDGGVGFCGDGGPARVSFLRRPEGLALDAGGNLYVADSGNNRIRRVDAATGTIVTVAGDGSAAYGGDGGPAARAALDRPRAVVIDREGRLVIADSGNSRIRRVDANGVITTIAGGERGFAGDGAAATAARLDEPCALAVDGAGNVYVVDQRNRVVRRIDAADGTIATVAGVAPRRTPGADDAATAVALTEPSDVAVEPSGALLIADQGARRIRRVAGGRMSTVAGNGLEGATGDGGPAAAARLGRALRIAVDAADNVWIADMTSYRIRRIDAATGLIDAVAGSGEQGRHDESGPALSNSFAPLGLALGASGSIYVTDLYGHVHRIDREGNLTTLAGGGPGF